MTTASGAPKPAGPAPMNAAGWRGNFISTAPIAHCGEFRSWLTVTHLYRSRMDELKGLGTTIATCYSPGNRLELIKYADGSWTISRDGMSMGVWEHKDQDDCFQTYERLIQVHGRSTSNPILAVILTKAIKSVLHPPSLN